jgi:hypothetical protein
MKAQIAFFCIIFILSSNYGKFVFSDEEMIQIASQIHLHQVGFSKTKKIDSCYDLTKLPIDVIKNKKNEILDYYRNIAQKDSAIMEVMTNKNMFETYTRIDSNINYFPEYIDVLYSYNNAYYGAISEFIEKEPPFYSMFGYYIFTKDGRLVNLVETKESEALQYLCQEIIHTDSNIDEAKKIIEIFTQFRSHTSGLIDSTWVEKLSTKGIHAPIEEMRDDHLYISLCFMHNGILEVNYFIYNDGTIKVEYNYFDIDF